MRKRKILYGYRIENGEVVADSAEAMVVGRVFTLYEKGESYKRISDTLNDDHIPFSVDAPLWNKQKVKRLLENPRYADDHVYPTIIEKTQFQRVQARIQEKTVPPIERSKHPIDYIKKKLCCATCGGYLQRRGGQYFQPDIMYLKCGGCGATVTIPGSDLFGAITRQVAEWETPAERPYEASGEVIRLTNAINRGLEHPVSPEDVVSLILQGVAARYDCCMVKTELSEDDHPTDVDWKHIQKVVSYIKVSKENAVTVCFR